MLQIKVFVEFEAEEKTNPIDVADFLNSIIKEVRILPKGIKNIRISDHKINILPE